MIRSMATDTSQISDREREILRLLAEGATNQQIAQQLNISVNTVKVHVRNIFGKIGVTSRAEAVLYAVRIGLVHVGGAPATTPPAETIEDPPAQEAAPAEVAPQGGIKEDLSAPTSAPSEIAVAEPALLADQGGSAPRADRRLLIGGVAAALLIVAFVAFVALRPTSQPQPSATATTSAGVQLPNPDERWRELEPLPSARSGFGLAYYDRKLYVLGGDVDGKPSDQVVRYDIAAQSWVALSAKPTAVEDVQAAVVGNKIYVPGGRLASGAISDKMEAYDPQRERWAALAPLPAPRSGYALVAVEGKLYLFGGWDGKEYRAEVWQYDPDRDSWAERTRMPTARGFAEAAATPEGQVYVLGGESAAGALAVNERYTPAEDDANGRPWDVQAPLPAPRSHMAAATANELIFVLSGADPGGDSLLYNSTIDTWQPLKTPLGASLRDLRAQAVGNKIYILGGRDAAAASAQTYEYQALYSVLLPLERTH